MIKIFKVFSEIIKGIKYDAINSDLHSASYLYKLQNNLPKYYNLKAK